MPVINALTDYNHPCQIMADILTVQEHRGHLEDLKIVYIDEAENRMHAQNDLMLKIADKL